MKKSKIIFLTVLVAVSLFCIIRGGLSYFHVTNVYDKAFTKEVFEAVKENSRKGTVEDSGQNFLELTAVESLILAQRHKEESVYMMILGSLTLVCSVASIRSTYITIPK